jgi:hypothetical protein
MSAEKEQTAGYTTYTTRPPSNDDLEDTASADRLLDKTFEKKVLMKFDF